MGEVRVAARSETAKRSADRLCTSALLTVPSLLLFALTVSPAAAQTNTKKTILVMYSSGDRGVYNGLGDLKSGLKTVIPWPLDFYVEYLEGMRFGDKEYKANVLEYLRNEYRGVKLDLVLAEKDPALEFALSHRNELFPGVPIVFFDVETAMGWQKLGAGVTGVTGPVDVRGTIDLALRLHPNTNTVAVIIGDSPSERYWLAQMHSELLRHRDKVKEVDLVGLTASQLFERSVALPSQTVVLFEVGREESPQPAVGTFDFLAWIAQRLPTYSIFAWYCLNHGGVGGDSYDGVRQISLLAPLVRRVLSGDRPENIPVVHQTEHHIIVDWRQLQKWHIPESALPAGSVVEFKPPSPWQQYKREIIGTLVVLVLLLALVVGLLTNLLRRRRAEASNKRLAGQLLHVQDEERRRMARDLHDGTSQDLVAISLCLGEVLQDPNPDPNETRQLLEEAHSLSLKAQREVRSVSFALHPPLLDGTGLVPALRWYFDGLRKRSSLRIFLEVPPKIEPMAEVDGTLFRIAQESMSNILRHSGADTAKVRLERDSRRVRMSIEDNGHGMGVETVSGNGNGVSLGVGIAGMRERVRQFGGTFEIRSGSTGTTVLVSLPVSERAYAANHASG